MPRQLNKELFQEQVSVKPFLSDKNESPELLLQDLAYQMKTLKRKVEDISKAQKNTELKIPKIDEKINKAYSKSQQNLQRLETAVKSSLQSFMNKFTRLSTKVTERNLQQTHVQELIDRHNSVLQQYELRLNKLQKVLSQQELQLINYKTTLQQLQKKHYL